MSKSDKMEEKAENLLDAMEEVKKFMKGAKQEIKSLKDSIKEIESEVRNLKIKVIKHLEENVSNFDQTINDRTNSIIKSHESLFERLLKTYKDELYNKTIPNQIGMQNMWNKLVELENFTLKAINKISEEFRR